MTRHRLCVLAFLALVACSKAPDHERPVKFYQSPMHPWITSPNPGNCTICGMKLVPVYEGDAGLDLGKDTILLGSDTVRVLDVAVVPVRRMELTRTLRVSGTLDDDENIHRIIAAFYDGRIDEIHVEHEGMFVRKGQPLASIYSPDLLYVVREFQNAMRGGNQSVARNAAQRLVQYGLSPTQVNELANKKDDVFTIDLVAPMDGTVLVKKAFKGQYIRTGEPLFEIGDLSRLWFHAEVYERDLPGIRVGQKAIVRTPTVPGRDFEGRVTFIAPNFDPRTRSTKVRIEVANVPSAEGSSGWLLPYRAYAEADLVADLGDGLVVPRSAVLRDGRRSVVYVRESAGRFVQRAVRTGRVGDEGIEILEGLSEGEDVVTQGNLMIDAEAQLRHGDDTMAASPPKTAPAGKPLAAEAHSAILAFLHQLANVSGALAADDAVLAAKEAKALPPLVSKIPPSGDATVDGLVENAKSINTEPSGSDLKALRKNFLPWSTVGAELALALRHAGQDAAVRVFECPMTAGSFPGAPSQARWIQSGAETRNPYFGAEMINCGAEIEP